MQINFEEDMKKPSENELQFACQQLNEFVNQHSELTTEIAGIEFVLQEKRNRLKEIEEESIPKLMDDLNSSMWKTKDGIKVEVQKVVSASITKQNQPVAHEWLREHGHSELIKSNLSLALGKGEEGTMQKIVDTIRSDFDIEPIVNENVHPMTLKAFVKDCLERGEQLPLETFGVFMGRKAKITK